MMKWIYYFSKAIMISTDSCPIFFLFDQNGVYFLFSCYQMQESIIDPNDPWL